MKKFSKAFGEVEVTSEDNTFTTIVIIATGEVKKLATKFANLSDEPFVKVKKVVVKKTPVVHTAQDLENIAYHQEMSRRQESYANSLRGDRKREYNSNKSKITHL